MPIDQWLPTGLVLPDGALSGRAIQGSDNWQIIETRGDGRALLARPILVDRWLNSGLIDPGQMHVIQFGSEEYWATSCAPSQMLSHVRECRSPSDKNQALSFAVALRETRKLDRNTPLQNSIYFEKLSRLLPLYGISEKVDDDRILGQWLTGGANVSATSSRRLHQMLSWLSSDQLDEIVRGAALKVAGATTTAPTNLGTSHRQTPEPDSGRPFKLPGRPELEKFISEHVIDVVRHQDRYRALGITFPGAFVLHGPPGCGKTHAVEQLIDFLGWPSFQIDASSVASPYIHETSRKIAEVFESARDSAPAIIVIDEMEAFLVDRGSGGSGHHRVEEVAEFLRRIPQACQNNVLVIAMTNRIEMIDAAILRRGRFDHIITVTFASCEDIVAMLENKLSTLPKDETVDARELGLALSGRPLSDVAFVVREGARLAARAGLTQLTQRHLLEALNITSSREAEVGGRRIGFV